MIDQEPTYRIVLLGEKLSIKRCGDTIGADGKDAMVALDLMLPADRQDIRVMMVQPCTNHKRPNIIPGVRPSYRERNMVCTQCGKKLMKPRGVERVKCMEIIGGTPHETAPDGRLTGLVHFTKGGGFPIATFNGQTAELLSWMCVSWNGHRLGVEFHTEDIRICLR
jgi:LSD1 subclass zinc finger protein